MESQDVDEEIRRRLRAQRMRGDFAAIHAVPASPEEVPDQAGARLVVLGPEHPHPEGAGPDASPALACARALLEEAGGGSPRSYRNMLVFLAADAARLEELRAAAAAAAGGPDEAVGGLVGETWQWLLAPSGAAGWSVTRASGREELAMRASRRLRADESLFVDYPAVRLRADLDRVPLWPPGAGHVGLAEVWEAYASSLELPRLRSSAVLAAAIVGGVGAPDWASATFAYATGWDAEARRYEGLVGGPQGNLVLQGSGLIVRPEVARAQLEAEG
jgi:hypothetical protein